MTFIYYPEPMLSDFAVRRCYGRFVAFEPSYYEVFIMSLHKYSIVELYTSLYIYTLVGIFLLRLLIPAD